MNDLETTLMYKHDFTHQNFLSSLYCECYAHLGDIQTWFWFMVSNNLCVVGFCCYTKIRNNMENRPTTMFVLENAFFNAVFKFFVQCY